MFHKREEQFVQGFGTGLRTKEGKRIGHDAAIELLAVTGDDHVAGFVDKAHGEQRAGMDCEVGILVRFPYLVHLVSEPAATGHIGKHDVAVEGEERVGELIAFTRLARNVKFHHKNRAPKPALPAEVTGRCTRPRHRVACRLGPPFPRPDLSIRAQTLQKYSNTPTRLNASWSHGVG